MTRRLTSHHYEALARKHQLEWLGEEAPKNILEKTPWRCSEGHRWEIPYRNIKYDGSGCPYCAGLAPRKVEDYHALAKQRGFEWLGPPVKNVRTKTHWRCGDSHTWFATYKSLQQGAGCPECAGVQRKTEVEYHALAKQRSFVWLGPMVENTQTKTQWQCSVGHTWLATYGSIYQRRHCPICAPREPIKETDYYALAKQRDFKWLGPSVKNTKTKTRWRCRNNHIWQATYSSIQQGLGCPICARSDRIKTEADYHALAERRGLEWLGSLPKNVNIKSEWRCDKNHTWLATYSGIRLRGMCPTCAGFDNQPKTEEEYYALAKRRGFEWLGPPVKNTKTKTQWQCSKGHTWFTSYNSIQRGSDCDRCSRLRRGQKA